MNSGNKIVKYSYVFTFSGGRKKEFEVRLHPVTANWVRPERQTAPEWARLDYRQCDNCPLDSSIVEFCPVALGIVELVDFFKDIVSYEEVDVSIITSRRNIWKRTSVQEGLSSLLGICIATNGCPVMEKLKPMARHHLPFASIDETLYRATSMYLLAQYYRRKKGMEPDWDLQELTDLYDNVKIANRGVFQRLRSASREDANVNALVRLDIFTWTLSRSIQDTLSEMECLFSAYLE